MLCRQFIYSPNYLLEILHKAYDFYTSTPGENLEYRRQNADLWLGNIRTLLQERNVRFDTTFPLMHSPVVLDYHTLVSCLGQGYDFWNKQLKRYPAIWFAGGCECTPNHFLVIDFITRNNKVLPIIWLEQEEYISSKERGMPFFPREVTLSILAHYVSERCHNRGIITMNPQILGINGIQLFDFNTGNTELLAIDEALKKLMKDLNIYAVFRNIGSPAYLSQLGRLEFQMYNYQFEIPHFNCPSTTQLVRI